MKCWRDAQGTAVRWYEEVGSSNDVAREWAESSQETRGVVWAERQTAGRGRRGNAWMCPEGEGLAISYWLRPELARSDWSCLALLAAVAITQVVIAECSIPAGIKWPNDVWVDGKKLAGVLVEVVNDVVIIGMGINVNVKTFPDELAAHASSLFLASGKEVDREAFLAKVVAAMNRWIERMAQERSRLLDEVRQYCLLRGRTVRLKTHGEVREVEVLGIGDGGELWVLSHGQPEAIWQADEIRPIL
ncbi:MAG: hypothetical protein RLZZ224_1791 [Verrucomicrobiota bacterium]|jgi:BirA family biotin operon repressor/biotin-[acetyl-CoA-carboxylase] ligase